jgi:hypothetical protein
MWSEQDVNFQPRFSSARRQPSVPQCDFVTGLVFVATEVTQHLMAPGSIWAYLPDIRRELEPGDRLVSSSTRSSQARERRNRSCTSAVRAGPD